MKVLLFDPDEKHRDLLEEVLQARGLAVETILQPDDERLDGRSRNSWVAAPLAILDGSERDVGELCRRIDALHDESNPCEILVMIDSLDPGIPYDALIDAGADDFLSVPLERRQVEARIRLADHRRRRRIAEALGHAPVEARQTSPTARPDKLFKTTFDVMPVGAYRLSPQGDLVEVNKALAELLGDPERVALIGRSLSSFFVDSIDREAWQALLDQDDVIIDFETEARRLDKRTLWIRTSIRATRSTENGEITGYQGTVEDITGRKQAEDALRRSEDRFRALVQHNSDLISIVDAAGQIVYQSPSSLMITGYAPAERIGRSVFDFVEPEQREQALETFLELLDRPGDQVETELLYQHRDGRWLICESTMTNQLDNPAVRGIVINTRDISDRKNAEKKLRHTALHDALTDLPNRISFMGRLRQALACERREGAHAVLFLDLDRFKMINDSLGHAVGDALLIEAGKRLQKCLRGNDLLSRLGGDEFAILLEDLKDLQRPARIAQRIQRNLAKPFRIEGHEVWSSTSIGIALHHRGEKRDADELLREADTAMYRAKARGRAGYALFDARMHAEVLEQLTLETSLRQGIEQGQFTLRYLPFVELETGRVTGFEALLRWNHPERGLLLPEGFLPVAEETGMVHDLGRYVFQRACADLAEWLENASDDIKEASNHLQGFISINLSPRQFAGRALFEDVSDALRQSDLDPRRLILEIPEDGVLSRHPETIRTLLDRLHSLGIGLLLDHFGTGQFSLKVLERFPFDHVKLDRMLLGGLDMEHGGDELVQAMVALCRWRGLEAIAGAVESSEQWIRLHRLGCVHGQGYAFGDVVTSQEASKMLGTSFSPD